MKLWHGMIKEETHSAEVNSIRGGCGKKWTENISESLLEPGWVPIWRCMRLSAPFRWKTILCLQSKRNIFWGWHFRRPPQAPPQAHQWHWTHATWCPWTQNRWTNSLHTIHRFSSIVSFSDSSSKSALPSAHWAPEIFDTKGKTWHFVCLLNFFICRLAQRRLGCIQVNRCSSMHSCGKVKHKLALKITQILEIQLTFFLLL